jgi:integrase
MGFEYIAKLSVVKTQAKGTHPKIVQEMLGHANISMTMDTYSHVLPDMQEKAVSAMDDVFS